LVGNGKKGAAGNAKARAAAAEPKAMVRALMLCALLLGAAAPSLAQETPGPAAEAGEAPATPRSWQSLSPQQQQLLHNFQGKWDSLPPEKQQALSRGSQRWIGMTPEQRSGAQERFKQFRALPPEQRQLLRQRWQQFKTLPPEQQQRVREQFRRFRQMPPAQRQELRRQWRQMSPEQRRGVMKRPPPAMHRSLR
jgi:Protein of unknown function (DUF3106)